MPKLSDIRSLYSGLNLTGKTAVVVGGTSGIGAGIATRLAEANVAVTVVGRSQARGDEMVEKLKALSAEGVEHRFVPCDAFSIGSVRKMAEEYSSKEEKLDYLVLSCGIATLQGRTETSEGIDEKLCVHYFSRVAFANKFLPLLSKSDDGRVISILSGGIHSPYKQYKEDFELRDNYSQVNAANCAGFYNDIGMNCLHDENPSVAFIHAAPGFVNTSWGTQMPTLLRWVIRAIQPLGRSSNDCGEYMCHTLFSDEFKGKFACTTQNGDETKVTSLHDEAKASVWENTKSLLSKFL